MAETKITRCPHCQTTFRIRTEQLSAAQGAVRCGSCLQVFKAAENLVLADVVQPEKNETVIHEAPECPEESFKKISNNKENDTFEKAADDGLISDDMISDDMIDNDLMADSGITIDDEISIDDISDRIEDDPLEDFGISNTDIDLNENYNSGVQLDDSVFSMSEGSSTSDSDGGFQFTEQFDSKEPNNYHDDSWASRLLEDDDAPSKKQDDDESWADALLEVDEDLLSDIDAGNYYTESNSKTNTKSSSHYNPAEKDDFVASLYDDEQSDGFQLTGNEDLEQQEIELSVNESVNDLHDEPLALNRLLGSKKVDITKQKKQKKYQTKSSYFWLCASAVMLLMIVAQISYFKFDTWSRHPDYRPAYETACEIVGCSLPEIQDIKQMNTQHFMVRPHTGVKGALYINTLLLNRAQYQQPFPDLTLIFTGLEDKVIASRSFKPHEYLAGELAGAKLMPSKVPVHIAFEIINPGAEAVSYRIEITANQ